MKKHPAKRLGILLGLLLTAALVWWASIPEKPSPRNENSKQESPFGEMDDFTYTRTSGGEINWRVHAAQAQYFAVANEARFTQVRADLHHDGRRVEVQSESGSVDLKTRRGRLAGHVRGQTDDGMVFQTPNLDFTAEPRRATTDEAVLLTGPSFRLEGTGMDLDLDEQKIRLKQNVRADWWTASKP